MNPYISSQSSVSVHGWEFPPIDPDPRVTYIATPTSGQMHTIFLPKPKPRRRKKK